MNSLKLEFGFGAQFDHDQHGIPRDQLQRALRSIKKEAARLFGAYTLVPTCGGWTNGGGRLVEEEGFTLFSIIPRPADHEAEKMQIDMDWLRDHIKVTLNQEAVATAIYNIDFTCS